MVSDSHKHEDRGHALLSSSGSSRWMNCTPSARKEEFIDDVTSSYALEGTLAHELSEIELKKHFGLINVFEYKNRLAAIEENELYSDDMPEFVDVYVSYCIEQYNYYKSFCTSVEISIEEKIDLTKYIPGGYGSNDFIIVADKYLEVIDLKYGRGVSVSAVENSQLKLYGLGSVYKHRLSYQMEDVKLTVVQPRTYSISSYIINVDELELWADTEVVTKAQMAHNGEGELNPGEWCKFCKFKPQCRAIYDQNQKLMEKDFSDMDKLSDEEIKEIFEKADQITSWVNAVNALVLDRLLKKEKFSGYKLVKGRSVRKFTDVEKVKEKLLEAKIDEEEFMSTPKLLGITAIEKLVGKKNFEVFYAELVQKTEAKPTIALSGDKRDDFFDSAENDFASSDFL
jgi:hypothetical protein